MCGSHSREGAAQAQEHFVDVGFADGKGRGEAQAVGLRGVEQQAFVKGGVDHGLSGIVRQGQSVEQTLATQFAVVVAVRQSGQAFAQMLAIIVDMLQEAAVVHAVEYH
ncbi:hypothetical protein D3C78_1622070 [compost metagenome]